MRRLETESGSPHGSRDCSGNRSGADSQLSGRDAWMYRLEHLAEEWAAQYNTEFEFRRLNRGVR
jgi:hypothetical protein